MTDREVLTALRNGVAPTERPDRRQLERRIQDLERRLKVLEVALDPEGAEKLEGTP